MLAFVWFTCANHAREMSFLPFRQHGLHTGSSAIWMLTPPMWQRRTGGGGNCSGCKNTGFPLSGAWRPRATSLRRTTITIFFFFFKQREIILYIYEHAGPVTYIVLTDIMNFSSVLQTLSRFTWIPPSKTCQPIRNHKLKLTQWLTGRRRFWLAKLRNALSIRFCFRAVAETGRLF